MPDQLIGRDTTTSREYCRTSLATVAFAPVPGIPELLIVLILLLFYAAVPILIAVAGIHLFWNASGRAPLEEELEQRVENRGREVESLRPDE
ncbi:hypothetical protein [Halomontanus rarus]|uniref:hypothetical protein n=1 Tax=Halomontanus rarus TaxID=3034020 RepID=UPI0023E83CFF|nr:hypothetical protein [Halovivax sp. TS33]